MNNKSLNSNLNKAKSKGADDQYTQRIDIEKELKHYKKNFNNLNYNIFMKLYDNK